MDSVAAFFKWLKAAHGINLTIGYDAFDRARFLDGLLTTIELSALCILFSVAVGLVGVWLQGARNKWLRGAVYWYIQFFRNTPPLVQLYFFYFAVGGVLPRIDGQPPIGNFAWAVITLSFFAGAFNVEIFRSGIEAVPKTMGEAAEALGLTRFKIFFLILLPLVFRICLPALNNNLVNLVKTTTLAYAIAVPELLYVAAQIWSDENNVREMMNVLLVMYVAIVGVLVYAMSRWERAMRLPGFGQ
ncbi:MAG: amino acid ABC transporter permease [Alphaproteobacteria bacterium]|nr:amino acid ABC transporter permease [Alphaproteobacteria bacterium]